MASESKAMHLIVNELRARRFHPVRIEDKSSTGTPDLNFHVPAHTSICGVSYSYGRDIWVELKDAKLEDSGMYSIKSRPAQRSWAVDAKKVGRTIWWAIRISPFLWLALDDDKGWKKVMRRFDPKKVPSSIPYGKLTSVPDLINHISS